MVVPLWAWFAVVGVILVMLAVDLVAHRNAHVVSVRVVVEPDTRYPSTASTDDSFG